MRWAFAFAAWHPDGSWTPPAATREHRHPAEVASFLPPVAGLLHEPAVAASRSPATAGRGLTYAEASPAALGRHPQTVHFRGSARPRGRGAPGRGCTIHVVAVVERRAAGAAAPPKRRLAAAVVAASRSRMTIGGEIERYEPEGSKRPCRRA